MIKRPFGQQYKECFKREKTKTDIESFFSLYGFKRERLTVHDDYELTKDEILINDKKLSKLFDLLRHFRFTNNEINTIYNRCLTKIVIIKDETGDVNEDKRIA